MGVRSQANRVAVPPTTNLWTQCLLDSYLLRVKQKRHKHDDILRVFLLVLHNIVIYKYFKDIFLIKLLKAPCNGSN
jgi:hypothetical protein